VIQKRVTEGQDDTSKGSINFKMYINMKIINMSKTNYPMRINVRINYAMIFIVVVVMLLLKYDSLDQECSHGEFSSLSHVSYMSLCHDT